MYEPESDAAPWSFFNVDQIFSNNYYGDSPKHDLKICHQQYIRDSHCDTDYTSSTDNDEIIARALFQEEFSRLSISESPESSHSGEEYSRLSISESPELSHSGEEYSLSSSVVPNLHDSSDNYFIGQEGGPCENVDVDSICSSPGDRSCDGDDSSYNLEIADEFELDGEVEKRLYQMFPVPHVPRINGEIPSVDEATSDHQRLLDRLKLYDLIEHKVQGDGNCQFRALSDQFYRTPEHHKFVRQHVVCQLKAHPEMYEGYVPMDYAEYLKRISKSGEWGDHVTLQAAADSYGVRILIVTSFKDTCYIEILPQQQKSKRVVYLSFWAEVHYNSIYPQGDLPPGDFKRKKKWWNFRNQH